MKKNINAITRNPMKFISGILLGLMLVCMFVGLSAEKNDVILIFHSALLGVWGLYLLNLRPCKRGN